MIPGSILSEVLADPATWAPVGLSFRVSIIATALAALLAIPTGLFLASRSFPGKKTIVTIINTMLSLPTVVVGLIVYSLLSQSGPLARLELLFTPTAIIIGQVLLALPVITALTYAAIEGVDPRVRATALTLGAGRRQADLAVLSSARMGILAAIVSGFGRVISEIGSVIMLGGNIEGYTRTITTAIVLENAKGEFGKALTLGLILLIIALGVNVLVHRALRRKA
jgi:tungstate transport system permease protein